MLIIKDATSALPRNELKGSETLQNVYKHAKGHTPIGAEFGVIFILH